MQLPKIEGEQYTYQPWPSWATGPNGEKQIFNSEGEVPAGWTHHGETKKGKAAPAPAPVSNSLPVVPAVLQAGAAPVQTPAAPAPVETPGGVGTEVDKAGVAFDPARHAATKTKTKAGLWRMKVGVARPENEGAAAPLDL